TRPAPADDGSTRKRPSPPPEFQALLDEVLRGVLERRGTCLSVLSNRAAILCAAWSPDGRHLATGDMAGRVHLWKLQSPGAKPTLIQEDTTGSAPGVTALVWAARGNHLACCGNDGGVQVMTVDKMEAHLLRPPYKAGTRDPWGLQLSPDGELLLGPYGNDGAGQGDTARHAAVLGVAREARVPVGDPGPAQSPRCAEVLDAAWAPGGERFATAGLDEVGVWRVTRREPRYTVTRQETFPVEGVRTVAWHPREPALAAGGAKGVVVFRGSGAELKQQHLETPDAVDHLAWSPDGQWLAAASTGTVRLWHADSGLLSNVLHVKDPSPGGLTWNPRRRGVLATWSGNLAQVWDVESGRVLATLTGHAGSIHQVVWRPDGMRLVTVSSDATARIWDDRRGGPERRGTWEEMEQVLMKVASPIPRQDYPLEFPLKPGAPDTAWAFYSPTDPSLAAIPDASSRSLCLWKGHDLRTAPSARGHGLAAAWSPNGRQVAVQDGPRTFSLWTDSGELKARGKEVDGDLMRWVWDPESRFLGLVLRDQPGPWFWDLTSEAPTRSPGKERGALKDLAWNPSGLRLATACDDGWARIYDVRSGCTLDTLLWSLRLVFPARRIAWSPDGQFLATGDAGGLVGIWDSRGYDLVACPQEHKGPIQHLVWNRSGSCLFTANESGRGLLWRQGSSDGRWVISAVLETEPTALRWATFSHDERWLLAMEADGAGIRRHPAEFEALVAQVASRRVPRRVREEGAPPRPAMPEPAMAAHPPDAGEADPGSWWRGYPSGSSPSTESHHVQ
ncbi:WD40 repeat domain-containing protein, partial [Corallococcus aberystwythensis]